MHPPFRSTRRGPLLVLVVAFAALLVIPVVIATVGVNEERDSAAASATTTEPPTTADRSTTSDPTTTTEPSTTTTETAPETTTTTIDLEEVYAFAAALDRSTSTTTTAPPVVEYVEEPEYVEYVEPEYIEEPVYEEPIASDGDPFAGLSTSDRAFLSCVRDRESRGDYTVVNPSSGAGGAYQFLRNTWNNTAAHAGRPDLVGSAPQYASAYDQDFLAAQLLLWQGRAPWSYSC